MAEYKGAEVFNQAKQRAEQWGQGHLLRFFDELDEPRQQMLLNDILNLDFELVCRLYEKAAGGADASQDADIRPIAVTDKRGLSPQRAAQAHALGMQAMLAGKYAVVTMAGGQGTRLGHSGPKGTYAIRLFRDTTIFEVQLDYIREMRGKTGKPLPWYIMTSEENHADTVSFFERNGYFGYPDITFFQQSSLPIVDLNGKILLEEKHRIKQGPDGNGSVFRSMLRSGVAEDMRRRGIEWFYMGNIDNILARNSDPLPVGLAMESHTPCASKSILKASPGEKAGVFCRKNGKPGVVEYTEISDAMAGLRDAAGNLVYGDAHISSTVFHTSVLDMEGVLAMPYHTAVKKAPYIGDDGERIAPGKENAYKFEAFIFDIFPNFENMVVLRVDREDEFAPIKNASGNDSPETARALYINAHQKLTQ